MILINDIIGTRKIAERIKTKINSNLDIPKISEHAESILSTPFKFVEKGMFKPISKKLRLTWIPSQLFSAVAFKKKDEEDYEVRLSYGVGISIYRDASQMTQMLLKAPMILGELNLGGNTPIIIKPPQIKYEVIFGNLMKLPLEWLFYHEIGHMIESHHLLSDVDKFLINDNDYLGLCIAETQFKELTVEEALVSQVLEISADFQGVRFLIRQLVVEKEMKSETVNELEIWALLVGVVCLFYHFYEIEKNRFHDKSEKIGSHPSPDIRFQFLLSNIVNMISDAAYAKTIPWATNEDYAQHILNHAWVFSSSYWNNFYEKNQLMPEMFSRGGNFNLNANKIENLKIKWKELRPQVARNIFKGVSTSSMDFG